MKNNTKIIILDAILIAAAFGFFIINVHGAGVAMIVLAFLVTFCWENE